MSKAEEKNHALDRLKSNRLIIFAHVTGYTIATIAIVAGIAYLLDQQFGTFPKIFIGGLVVGYPLTQFVLYKKIRKLSDTKLKKAKK